jgi:hypothetical protein
VRFDSQTDALEVRLAEFLRKLLSQTERNGESVRSPDRQNAEIAGAKFDLKLRRRVSDTHCWVVVRALDRVGRHGWQGHQQGRQCLDREDDSDCTSRDVLDPQPDGRTVGRGLEIDQSADVNVVCHGILLLRDGKFEHPSRIRAPFLVFELQY